MLIDSFLLAADVALIGGVIHFVYLCLHKPAEFVRWESGAKDQNRFEEAIGLPVPWSCKSIFYCALVLIGLLLLMFGGIKFMFSWMPHSWTTFADENGERHWLPNFLGGMTALFGAIGLGIKLSQTAEKLNNLENLAASRERLHKQIEALASAVAGNRTELSAAVDKIESEIEEEFKTMVCSLATITILTAVVKRVRH